MDFAILRAIAVILKLIAHAVTAGDTDGDRIDGIDTDHITAAVKKSTPAAFAESLAAILSAGIT